jgi:hypothetical protein
MGPGTEDAMHLMYFTEQPMSAYPSDIGLATGHTALMFSNKYFDSAAGSRLYNDSAWGIGLMAPDPGNEISLSLTLDSTSR